MDYKIWATYTSQELAQKLQSSLDRGLDQALYYQHKKNFGENSITSSGKTLAAIFLRQFNSPFTCLLLGAALLSYFLSEHVNTIAITIIVIINVALSIFQEYRAECAVQLLRKYLLFSIHIIRNGIEQHISSTDLVPGDLVLLAPGDPIPADLRLIESHNLQINESSFTGESLPVTKDAANKDQNILFTGTSVVNGTGKAFVIAIGNNTYLGSISSLTTATQEQSLFQRNIALLSAFIIKLIGVSLIILVVMHLLLHGSQDISDLIMFAVALAIAVTPEALPLVTTWSLSRGALILAKQQVLVKRLTSIEDLGSIDVLCSDKTGTLTENHLKVNAIKRNERYDPLWYANLCTLQADINYNPFARACYQALTDEQKELLNSYISVWEKPFDPQTRYSQRMIEHQGKFIFIVQGAHEAIFAHCSFTPQEKADYEYWIAQQGKQAHRVIAIGFAECSSSRQEVVSQLHLAGCIAFEDPLRPTASQAIKRAQELGIKIKILTGDSEEVTRTIALKIGLIKPQDPVIAGEEFDILTQQQKAYAVEHCSVFTRISPQQKFDIIELLKCHHGVGFLGEGINDAPALKSAHVGIVVEGATDIAKDAADIILLNPSLLTIIDGIALGRITFTNTVKYIVICLISTFGTFYSMIIASLILDYLPMLPLQLLLVNFLSDAPAIALATDTTDPTDLRSPKTYRIRDIVITSTIFAILSSIFDFILFAHFYKDYPAVLQTHWFIATILAQIVCIFSMRTRLSCFKAIAPSKTLIIFSILSASVAIGLPFSQFGQRYLQFIQPTLSSLFFVLILILSYFITNENAKYFLYKWLNRG